MGIIASSIKEKLTQSFTPSQLEVIDESAISTPITAARVNMKPRAALRKVIFTW